MIVLDTNVVSALMRREPEPIVMSWFPQAGFKRRRNLRPPPARSDRFGRAAVPLPTLTCYADSTMAPKVLHVQADWDSEASVWVATSDDVPGLATEAETIEVLTEKLRTLIPELLEVNMVPSDPRQEVVFELTSHRQESVRLAS